MQSFERICSAIFVFLFVTACMFQPLVGSDIVGTVVDSDGEPIAGAIVGIYTAGPRVGTGVL